MTDVVLVVDTGVDDALALVVAARHPALTLVGAVATAGNVSLPLALANTRTVLAALDVDVPLAGGSARRSDGSAFPPRGGHGIDGLAGLGLARSGPDLRCSSVPPVAELLADLAPGALLVSLGPLTPLLGLPPRRVLAVAARPGEANHTMDPHAAQRVRAWPHLSDDPGPFVVPVPVDVERLPRRGCAGLVRHLLLHQQRRGAGLGDAGALLRLAAAEPDELLRLV